MNERAVLWLGAVTGAVAGAAAAFLVFTERGRAMRDELEPLMGDLAREAGRLQGAVEQIRASVEAARSSAPPAAGG